MRRIFRVLRWVLICAGVFAYYLGIFWHTYEPLKKYGVSYAIVSGEHAEYQHLDLSWERNHTRIDGPSITGDDLYVVYKHVDHEEAPEMVVRSRTYKSYFAIFKLNFTDSSKPGFELIANQMMGVEYPPPWGDYYKTDLETHALLPEPAKETH